MLVDERADVFSLAVVTWQALCGTDPFAAVRAADSLTKIFHGPKDPLVKLDPTADLTAQDALMRALAPQASERTACVDEMCIRDSSTPAARHSAARRTAMPTLWPMIPEVTEPLIAMAEEAAAARAAPARSTQEPGDSASARSSGTACWA